LTREALCRIGTPRCRADVAVARNIRKCADRIRQRGGRGDGAPFTPDRKTTCKPDDRRGAARGMAIAILRIVVRVIRIRGCAVRRRFNDALVSAGALLIVLVALMAVDGRVRNQVTSAVTGVSSPHAVAASGGKVRYVAGVVVSAAREQSIEHAPMVIFVVAASVLVTFMLRL
jgi:hypothetical protein